MNNFPENKIFKELIDRASKNYKIEEVKFESFNYQDTLNYLKKQKFLEFKKIETILVCSSSKEFPIGYIMLNMNKEIIGFMGSFFSKKKNNNQEVTTCNIHTWIVEKKVRIYSFFLITPLLEKNFNLTAFTPVESLKGLLKKSGLKEYTLNTSTSINLNFLNIFNKNILITDQISFNNEKLKPKERELFANFSTENFIKFKITNLDKNENIFIIGSKIKIKNFPCLKFIYISDKKIFKNLWNKIVPRIFSKYGFFIFSETYFENNHYAIPKKYSLFKTRKKYIYAKNISLLSCEDILHSDLIV